MNKEERDNTYSTILKRYRMANEHSIVTSNAMVFNSLRDVYYLVQHCKELVKKNKLLEEKLAHLVIKHDILKEEIHGK